VPMLEDTKPEPEDPYGISKYAVEMDLMAARRLFGLNYIIFRPHNVYGERQNIGDKYRNVIGIFMNQVMRGEPCTIFGDGSQTRAFSHIGDIAPAIARSITVPAAYNQVFNIGADIPYSVKDLAGVVQRVMGQSTGIRYLKVRDEVLHAYSDHNKAAQNPGLPADYYAGGRRHPHGKMGLGFGAAIRAQVQSDRNRKISAGRWR
jgi:UDP-glucose 4-epimerase